MKTLLILLSFTFLASTASIGQSFRKIDKSPADIAYMPDNFAHDNKTGESPTIKVVYSRPQMNGREIFGKLVPYGKVWRTGANEATEIKVFQDIEIGGKALKSGTYSLFTIPEEKDWTVIFSSDLDIWGAYSYKEANDVLRVKATVKPNSEAVEAFSIQFDGQFMRMAWDRTIVELPVKH